ncbi:DNA polymerase delta subunit 4 [Mortierella sp. AM989]|nr:DNA polymerase delta subunit 4 [Mortierella sp. AM989]
MAPPKKSTATLDTNANFFQRGKKSTISQRVVTGKKIITPAVAPNKTIKQEDDESDHIDDAEFSDDEQASQHSEQNEDDLEELMNDEIQSDYDDSDSAADLQKTDKTSQLKESINAIKKTAEITKITPKRKAAATRIKKTTTESDYVVPYVGDIYVGFHQADISDTEKFLRKFDLASKYGPCTELTRLERWERAFDLGLEPPQDVKDTLVAHITLNTPIFEGRV